VSAEFEHTAARTDGNLSSRGMTDPQVRIYSALDELPAAYRHLFDEASQAHFFLTLPWFQNFVSTALDENCRLRIYAVGQGDGMLLARTTPPRRELFAATNFYSCFFAPHLSGSSDHIRGTLQTLVRAIGAEKPRWDTIDIQPLDVNSQAHGALVAAFREAGFMVQTFFCFGNWYLPVNGRGFAEYVESLPSVLKNTLSRKRKKLEKTGRATIQVITGGDELEAAIEAYTKVYIASWKRPEPYPEFIPGLIRLCAAMGTLRLGLVCVDGEPAAAQLWIVYRGSALIYKLAYDERFADLSVGTILTATLMQHVLDVDKVQEIDYLSGDDAYKKDWMSHRRERWGLLAMNPWTVGGIRAIIRHVGGRTVKRAGLWVSRRLQKGNAPAG
jgi:hypothetical protein